MRYLKVLTAAVIILISYFQASGSVFMPQVHLSWQGEVNYEEYIPGTLTVEETPGNIIELNALYKTRGATARMFPMKPSLNVKLRDADGGELDYNLLGIREASSFILDAMAIDRICMRNRVCFDIWNDLYRLPYSTDFDSRDGTVGKFVEVYINGDYKGIYCLSDKINRKLLNLKKPKVDEATGQVTLRGLLYKQGTSDIEDQNTPGMFLDGLVYVVAWHNAWELHEPEEYAGLPAWEPLLDFYKNDASYSYVKNHFFLNNLADFTLHLMALNISDNWGNKNKYFSIQNIQEEGDASKFIVTPWDLDTSLGGEWDGSKYDGDYNMWTPQEIVNNANEPFAPCIRQQEFMTMVRDRWIETRNGVFAVDSVAARLWDYCNYFEDSGAWERMVDYWDAKKERPLYVKDLPKEISLIVEWYANRHKQLDEFFQLTAEEMNSVGLIETDGADSNDIFTLQGIRVKDMIAPGVYIVGGKKIFFPGKK